MRQTLEDLAADRRTYVTGPPRRRGQTDLDRPAVRIVEPPMGCQRCSRSMQYRCAMGNEFWPLVGLQCDNYQESKT